VMYRPFIKQNLYADYTFSQAPGQTRGIFPAKGCENRAICVPGVGSTKPFSALIVDCMPDLHFVGFGQCFPRFRYERREQSTLLNEDNEWVRVDNISDKALAAFRSRYGDPDISKDWIFYYVYVVLHANDYHKRFTDDRSKTLPRIPFAPEFQALAEAGQTLSKLHLGYETGPQYPLATETTNTSGEHPDRLFGTRAMRLTGDDNSVLVVNEHLRISGIPTDAHRYVVNGRTPLGWFIDRYRISTDKKSGITNNPNAWFPDEDNFISAVRVIVHLAVDTTRIVDALPNSLVD